MENNRHETIMAQVYNLSITYFGHLTLHSIPRTADQVFADVLHPT